MSQLATTETTERPAARLLVRRASKQYGGEHALRDAHLEVRPGEVHALVGENGAGKSTLIRLLAGVERADVFDATFDGAPLQPSSPSEAHRHGLRFVHQELNVVPSLSVAENVHLGRPYPRTPLGLVAWRTLRAATREVLARLGVEHIEPAWPMHRLRPGDAMLVALARAFVGGGTHDAAPRLYVFDEPTAALSHQEIELLFGVIATLKREGVSVMYVSHRMDEIFRIADRITVLRDGRTVTTTEAHETTRAALIHAMTGRTSEKLEAPLEVEDGAAPEPVLRVAALRNEQLDGVTFDLRPNEVTVLTGLAGAGRSEVLRAVIGADPLDGGSIEMAGAALADAPARQHDPHAAWRAGIAYVPEERRSEALWMGGDVRSNVLLPHLHRVTRLGFADRRAEHAEARGWLERVDLRARGLGQVVRELSGGNQQKVVLARALAAHPTVLLLDEPTRGVDVGAKEEIYRLVRAVAANGAAVLAVTSDLEEVFTLADRVLVLARGRIVLDARAHLVDRTAVLTASFQERREAA